MSFIPDYGAFQKSISVFLLVQEKLFKTSKKEFLLLIQMVNGKFRLKQVSIYITIAEDCSYKNTKLFSYEFVKDWKKQLLKFIKLEKGKVIACYKCTNRKTIKNLNLTRTSLVIIV